jgi:hypothetical protein
VRQVDELLSDEDSWRSAEAAIAAGRVRCEVLPSDDQARACLYALRVTTRPVLGALAAHCGGPEDDGNHTAKLS